MSTALEEFVKLNRLTDRRTQAIKASMGLLSALGHAMCVHDQEGEILYAAEARECEYEVDLMLDAIAERVVEKIEERAKTRKGRPAV